MTARRAYYKKDRIAGVTIKCANSNCEAEFTRTHRGHAYCSKACAHSAQRSPKRVCENCHRVYQPSHRGSRNAGAPQVYCSKVCVAAAQWAKGFCAKYVAARNAQTWRECKQCRGAFLLKRANASFCSVGCQQEHVRESYHYHPRELTLGSCARCGKEFLRNGNARFCSVRCNKRNHSGKHAARAKRRGLPYEHISPVKVFERDNWICQICGELTDKTLIGTRHDLSPELDHVLAIGLGGSSTYDNVQCTCRKCNREKGRDEHRMFVARGGLSRVDRRMARNG
jgi:hypothetical protein